MTWDSNFPSEKNSLGPRSVLLTLLAFPSNTPSKFPMFRAPSAGLSPTGTMNATREPGPARCGASPHTHLPAPRTARTGILRRETDRRLLGCGSPGSTAQHCAPSPRPPLPPPPPLGAVSQGAPTHGTADAACPPHACTKFTPRTTTGECFLHYVFVP